MIKIKTQYLPEEQKKRLHPDFVKNEQQYWRMRDHLLQQYQGKWVAVHQRQVVAISQDIFDITDQVGKLGCHAYIAKVGEEDKVVFQVRRKDFVYHTSSQGLRIKSIFGTLRSEVADYDDEDSYFEWGCSSRDHGSGQAGLHRALSARPSILCAPHGFKVSPEAGHRVRPAR